LAVGPELGTYFPVGVALRLIDAEKGAIPQDCLTVIAPEDSVANLQGLRGGRYQLTIAAARLFARPATN
jgi:hypothetical protein